MRRLCALLAMLAAGLVSGRADIVITLDSPAQSGSPGDSLVFSGVLSNTGDDTVFLNSVDLNLLGTSFTLDFVDPFLDNVPVSLDPGQSTPDIVLFDVAVNEPFTDPPGPYTGTYTLLGGVDSNAQDVLASADFMITETNGTTVVPEPRSAVLLGTGLMWFVFLALRRFRSA